MKLSRLLSLALLVALWGCASKPPHAPSPAPPPTREPIIITLNVSPVAMTPAEVAAQAELVIRGTVERRELRNHQEITSRLSAGRMV